MHMEVANLTNFEVKNESNRKNLLSSTAGPRAYMIDNDAIALWALKALTKESLFLFQ